MTSHGAMKEAAVQEPSLKKQKNELRHIMLEKAEGGGVIAEHRMTQFDAKEPKHVFGSDEGHKLAVHIEKHMGIKMPGRAEGTTAEEPAGEEE